MRKPRVITRMTRVIGRIGFSRNTAVVALRRAYPRVPMSPVRQAASLVAGATLIGAGVSLFLGARLGVPPFDVLISSLAHLLGVQHGQAAWIASGVLFVVAAVLGRPPSLWGLGYVLCAGAAVNVVSGLIAAPDSMALRLGFVGVGTVLLAAGISLVVHAGTTGGSFELLMAAGADRGLDPSRVRLLMEISVVVLGVVLGGSFGPATVFFAVTIAPLLRLTGQALNDHRAGREARLQAPTAIAGDDRELAAA